jgi:2,4-dienoyl-CoA reductase-like NADH-dependent reductase (Old Yellow Enzyme family)
MTPALFTPFTLRGLTLRNRIVVSPMCQYLAEEGMPNAWHMAHHARFALGGVGAAIVEATAVTRAGRITHGCAGLWNDAQRDAWAEVVRLYHAHDVAVGVQLGHAGGKGATARPWEGAGPLPQDGAEPPWETIGPSDVPIRANFRPPRPATATELKHVVAAFAAAAQRSVQAGFDLIELHGAHGYLLHSFLSPVTNRRDDAFGGDLRRRMELPLRVARAVRGAIPGTMPLFWRASVQDDVPDGLTPEDTIALAKELRASGVDLIDCSSGGIGAPVSLMQRRMPNGYQVHLAEAVRRRAEMPTMAVGLIVDPAQANAVIVDGRADLVALARELLADPNWPYHAALELGLDDPHAVLPRPYAFYLRRRAEAQGMPLPRD